MARALILFKTYRGGGHFSPPTPQAQKLKKSPGMNRVNPWIDITCS